MLGIAAGLAGIEHGYFEILRGNTRPDGVMIASMGPPCVADKVWNACEPALTIVPNFLLGILAVLLGAAMVIWAAVFVQRRRGGAVLMLLVCRQPRAGGAALSRFAGGARAWFGPC